MSAAANAAGYLFFHRRLPGAAPDTQAGAERPHQAAEPQLAPVQEARAPRVEYRKRRSYALPLAA